MTHALLRWHEVPTYDMPLRFQDVLRNRQFEGPPSHEADKSGRIGHSNSRVRTPLPQRATPNTPTVLLVRFVTQPSGKSVSRNRIATRL
jgi:hypothetical protein